MSWPPRSARLAAAIPVLVDVVDGVGHRVAEAGLARDRGPALTAELLDRVSLARTRQTEMDQAAEAPRERLGRGQGADRERGVCRIARSIVDWRPLSAMSSPPKMLLTAAAFELTSRVLEERGVEQRLAIVDG